MAPARLASYMAASALATKVSASQAWSGKTPIPILYQKNIYRTSSESPYERLNSERENHGYNLCREVLIDMLLLSKCDYFLRSKISAVSLITTILSENIKKIYNT